MNIAHRTAPRILSRPEEEVANAACHARRIVYLLAAASRRPHLAGIIGRPAGTVEGFKYSDAMANSGMVWDQTTIAEYLANRMAFVGLRKPEDIADIIPYPESLGGDLAEGKNEGRLASPRPTDTLGRGACPPSRNLHRPRRGSPRNTPEAQSAAAIHPATPTRQFTLTVRPAGKLIVRERRTG